MPDAPRSPPGDRAADSDPFRAPRIDDAQRRFWLTVDAMIAALVVVALIGGWSYAEVRASLRDLRTVGLQSLLEAEARGLQLWIGEKRADAERWAASPQVRRAAAALVARARGGEYCAARPQRALQAEIAPYTAVEEVAVFNLVTREGRVVSSPRPEYCGAEVAAAFRRELDPVFAGTSAFVRPWPERDRLLRDPAAGAAPDLLWIGAPVRSGQGEVIAALGFGRVASRRFAKLLAISPEGTTREAYAFDGTGRIITESRHARGAEAAGTLEAREPAGGRLTALAQAALAREEGDAGVLLEPYRNYRGVEVIGAWRWLPRERIAIALEIEAAEAYGPLRYLQVAFATLFALVLVAMTAAASASLWAVRARLREARRIGPYRIERELGEGGMCKVYSATHTLLGRPAAVKVLKPHLATDEAVGRFQREARLTSRLTHPNTIEVYDYGVTRDARWYYAMELLRGSSIEAIVRTLGPMPAGRVVHALRQACASLKEAHERGWVHRDVKPANIMMCVRAGEHDVVKVLDFGLVKSLRDPSTRDLTQYSRILGTPLYMAPERLRDPADADARADIYALCAVAWFALAGRAAFEAETDHDIIYRVMNEPVPGLAAAGVAGVPAPLEALIARGMAKDRAGRPADIAVLQAELERIAVLVAWTEADARAWWTANAAAVGLGAGAAPIP